MIISQKKKMIKIRLTKDALDRRGPRAFLNPIGHEGGYLSIASRERTSTVAALSRSEKIIGNFVPTSRQATKSFFT